MKNIKKNQGFTLIELLVVIALIGISIGMISMTSGSGSSNLRKSIHAADSLLARCRINSLYRAEPVFIEFAVEDGNGNVVGIFKESGADGEIKEVDTTVLSRSGITVNFIIDGTPRELTRNNSFQISFTRRGRLILVDENGDEIDGNLTEIQFSTGTYTYVVAIVPETGHRRVRAG
jgi:prepilin-type N-terminal cleavage/methylation domain-containing protein